METPGVAGVAVAGAEACAGSEGAGDFVGDFAAAVPAAVWDDAPVMPPCSGADFAVLPALSAALPTDLAAGLAFTEPSESLRRPCESKPPAPSNLPAPPRR